MNLRRVVVTGMGVVAPNGIGVDDFWILLSTGGLPFGELPLRCFFVSLPGAAEVHLLTRLIIWNRGTQRGWTGLPSSPWPPLRWPLRMHVTSTSTILIA
jgi:hypothetical protein